MSADYKVSNAYIVRPEANRIMRLVEYANPEIIFPTLIQEYFNEVGYMKMYPYFSTLRISSIHPFALMLYQEVSGTKVEVSLFPSITVADSSDSEVYDTIGREHTEMMLGAEDVERLKDGVARKLVLTSDENITRLEAATANGKKVFCTAKSFRANHNIDMNIWADNKDMVSLIYDLLKHFIISNLNTLHILGIDIEGAISGRRSGDVNVEFGKLLYGANVTIPAIIETSDLVVDLEGAEGIKTVVTTTPVPPAAVDPEFTARYHVLGEA